MSSSKTRGRTERATIEELLGELRSLVNEAEDLLRTAGDDESDGPLDAIRDRVEAAMGKVRERLEGAEEVGERARAAGRTADAYVRDNPWAAIAVAVGLGYLVGRIGRRD